MADINATAKPFAPAYGDSMREFHPAANIFRLLAGEDFAKLVNSVRTSGLIEPIWLDDQGRILDGRNRYRACLEAGVEPRYRQWDGAGLAADFVWALNADRRHDTDGERQMAAGRYAIERESEAKERQGTRTDMGTSVSIDTEVEFGRSREEAAEKFGISQVTVSRAVAVVKKGAPELVAAVEEGKVSVSAAAELATLPKEEQVKVVALTEREILEQAKIIKAKKADARRTERVERIEAIAAGNAPLVTDRRYPIIYADPPWRYENPPIGDTNRSIENHYPTMDLADICALPVADIAAEDALLYLWATAPKLPECLKVIEAWGFEYRTHIVWVKDRIGTGYHARNQHELLLIAKRGEMPPPRPGEQPSSVIEAPRNQHSAKPSIFAETIERLYPGVGKIELFCRSPREGWASWGNQAQQDVAA